MFLFCFIPSNKHGCLMYRSFKSFWITFVPPTASSIMSKLPELFYLSLFVNDFKHAFTYRGMYDLNKKKTKHGPNPHAGTTWVRLLRAVPKWVFLTGISQDGDSIISVDNLFQYLTVITVIFFFPCIQFRFPMSWLMPFVTHVLLQCTFEKSLALSSLALCSWRQQ